MEEIYILWVDRLELSRKGLLEEGNQWFPVLFTVEDYRDLINLASLYKRNKFKELIERAKASREVNIHIRGEGEHHLSRKEIAELVRIRCVRVELLFMREFDVEPYAIATSFFSILDNTIKNGAVSKMDAIKSANGEDRVLAGFVGLGAMKYLHAAKVIENALTFHHD